MILEVIGNWEQERLKFFVVPKFGLRFWFNPGLNKDTGLGALLIVLRQDILRM